MILDLSLTGSDSRFFYICGPEARVSKVPITFWALKAKFEIKACWIVAQFLAHKPVNFASLTDSFSVSFSKLLKLWSWMKTRQTLNSFSGPKSYRDFQEMGLLGISWKTWKNKFFKKTAFLLSGIKLIVWENTKWLNIRFRISLL